jgi:ribosome biogenesis GTPase A
MDSEMQSAGKPVQWYPGHIAKLERKLDELLKRVDVVIEVVDARIPRASVNPKIQEIYLQKRPTPVLRLFNKADLADPAHTERWLTTFQKPLQNGDHPSIAFKTMPYQASGKNVSHTRQKTNLIQACITLAEPKMQKMIAKGLKRRPIRTMVVGMPNVGKSTLINHIIGFKKTKTGHKAGVTRDPQWVRIHPQLELLDTPGLIPSKLSGLQSGLLLAAVSSVGEAAFDDEQVARFLLHHMHVIYPGRLHAHYRIPPEVGLPDQPLSFEQIAQARQFLANQGALDTYRAAQHVLSDFRHGNWGPVTLEPC